MQVRFLPCKVNFPITSDYQILRKQEKHSWQTVSRKKTVKKSRDRANCGNALWKLRNFTAIPRFFRKIPSN